jgi:hypothetical protein
VQQTERKKSRLHNMSVDKLTADRLKNKNRKQARKDRMTPNFNNANDAYHNRVLPGGFL